MLGSREGSPKHKADRSRKLGLLVQDDDQKGTVNLEVDITANETKFPEFMKKCARETRLRARIANGYGSRTVELESTDNIPS
jgi:hypothetical protein